MKKKLLTILISLFVLPIYTIAYSNYVIPGGETLGIKVNSDGVLVVGFYKINNKYNKTSWKVGDYIISVMDNPVTSLDDLTTLEDFW